MRNLAEAGHRQLLRDWWINDAGPLWLERGVDWRGPGYFDQLDFSDARNAADYKRVRVCARQIFVFSRLAEAGLTGANDAVGHGLACLFGPMRHPRGGFVQSIELSGRVLSDKRDLYDQAFVLFALAYAYRLTGDERLCEEALVLADLILREFRHPRRGFVEALPPLQPRRQNPHMHLLEACLAWVEQARPGPWSELANELVGLMREQFWSKVDRRLYEYFDDDLELDSSLAKQIFEPGHHFEWIHLLHEARRLGLVEPDASMLRDLAETALGHGIAPDSGIPFGAIARDNTVADPQCRVWQLCEWLRVAALYPQYGGHEVRPAGLLIEMLDVPVAGLWRERRNAVNGVYGDEACPASSLYHIMTGCESFAFDNAVRRGPHFKEARV